jgi:hypothetical protein
MTKISEKVDDELQTTLESVGVSLYCNSLVTSMPANGVGAGGF